MAIMKAVFKTMQEQQALQSRQADQIGHIAKLFSSLASIDFAVDDSSSSSSSEFKESDSFELIKQQKVSESTEKGYKTLR
jgi:hypothetical protein